MIARRRVSRFEYFKSRTNGQWYFHIKAGNNKIVCQSEGYKRERDCLTGVSAAARTPEWTAVRVEAPE